MSWPKILACGEILWDLFPEGPRLGGAPANFASQAARLGGVVTILSAVGQDARGDESLAILQRLGVDISLVQRNPDAPTGSVAVRLDSAGKPSFTIQAGSAWDRMHWTAELEARTAGVDAIYFGTLGQRGESSRATIRLALHLANQNDILRVLDVNLRNPFYDAGLIRESIALASILKLSDDELPQVAASCGIPSVLTAAETLQALRQSYGLDLVVMTRGAQGALLVSGEEIIDQPGIPTTVVDTVGAGDSFTASLTTGLLGGLSHSQILREACAAASAVCAQRGGIPDCSHPRTQGVFAN